MSRMLPCRWLFLIALVFVFGLRSTPAEVAGWTELFGGEKPFEAWKGPSDRWVIAGDVSLDPANPRHLAVKPGKGIVTSLKGNAQNLLSKQAFGDVELHVEFLIPKGSNSGVKFHGHYEVQINDSYGKTKKLTGEDCGGIYPRAELHPNYHHIDDGIPPRVNACKPPGEWQTLDIIFLAPRFDASGKKVANARIVKAVLNGQVVQENQELATPTGDRWKEKEYATGPLYVQADHGPVAFRHVRIRPYVAETKKD